MSFVGGRLALWERSAAFQAKTAKPRALRRSRGC